MKKMFSLFLLFSFLGTFHALPTFATEAAVINNIQTSENITAKNLKQLDKYNTRNLKVIKSKRKKDYKRPYIAKQYPVYKNESLYKMPNGDFFDWKCIGRELFDSCDLIEEYNKENNFIGLVEIKKTIHKKPIVFYEYKLPDPLAQNLTLKHIMFYYPDTHKTIMIYNSEGILLYLKYEDIAYVNNNAVTIPTNMPTQEYISENTMNKPEYFIDVGTASLVLGSALLIGLPLIPFSYIVEGFVEFKDKIKK